MRRSTGSRAIRLRDDQRTPARPPCEVRRFDVVDIAPSPRRLRAANLQACGNCADKFARELGADYAFTGFVYKVSELVLSMSVFVHDAAMSKPVTSATVDLRGNTDESWRRGVDYLYRNVLSAGWRS